MCILLNLILIPRYGTIGSAWVTIFTLLISGFIGNFFINPYRPIAILQLKALFTGYKELKYLKKMRHETNND